MRRLGDVGLDHGTAEGLRADGELPADPAHPDDAEGLADEFERAGAKFLLKPRAVTKRLLCF